MIFQYTITKQSNL